MNTIRTFKDHRTNYTIAHGNLAIIIAEIEGALNEQDKAVVTLFVKELAETKRVMEGCQALANNTPQINGLIRRLRREHNTLKNLSTSYGLLDAGWANEVARKATGMNYKPLVIRKYDPSKTFRV